MADQGQKTITIDDLVNELTKDSAASAPTPRPVSNPQSSPMRSNVVTQSTPSSTASSIPSISAQPSAPSVQRASAPATTSPNQSQPISRPSMPSASPAPSQPISAKPVVGPVNTPVAPAMPAPMARPVAPQPNPSPTSQNQPNPRLQGIKEYQSSIRTMSSDMANIKSGQQVRGVQIPRKIEERPVSPVVSAPVNGPGNPISTDQPGQKVTITMGIPEKANEISSPKIPSQSVSMSSLPKSETQIIIPEGGRSYRNLIFISIAVVALLVGAAYWYFGLKDSDLAVVSPTPVLSVTPRPTLSPTPTPEVILSNLISGNPKTIDLPTAGDPLAYFVKLVKEQVITAGDQQKLNIAPSSGSMDYLPPAAALDRFMISYPAALKTLLGMDDSLMLVHAQREYFDSKGKPITPAKTSNRLMIISEVSDKTASLASMSSWESTMAGDLNGILELGYKSGAKVVFLNNIYGGATIRYTNFPNPDRSIDYAIMTASNGKNYLIIASSREAMYAAIDQMAQK